jgi:hypothetical protein
MATDKVISSRANIILYPDNHRNIGTTNVYICVDAVPFLQCPYTVDLDLHSSNFSSILNYKQLIYLPYLCKLWALRYYILKGKKEKAFNTGYLLHRRNGGLGFGLKFEVFFFD